MTTKNHTPTPWIAYKEGDDIALVISKKEGTIIKGVPIYTRVDESFWNFELPPGIEEANANTEFIVRAVNSHYELVEALKMAIKELVGVRYHADHPVINELEALVTKVENK